MQLNFTLDGIGDAAKKLLEVLQDRKVLAFHGQMGAGKTTFISAFVRLSV